MLDLKILETLKATVEECFKDIEVKVRRLKKLVDEGDEKFKSIDSALASIEGMNSLMYSEEASVVLPNSFTLKITKAELVGLFSKRIEEDHRKVMSMAKELEEFYKKLIDELS